MADLTTFGQRPSRRMWTVEPQIEGPLANFTIPAAGSITFYDGQALGRDATGGIVQMDDTLKAEFIGFQTDVVSAQYDIVYSTDTLGDKRAKIHRPLAYVALIAATVSPGQEGQKVYWLYNNQVALNGLTNWNYAGRILGVLDSTHVLVLVPWLSWANGAHSNSKVLTTAAAAPYTLTKFDAGALVNVAFTSAEAINLPLSTTLSPGDRFDFIVTAAAPAAATLTPASGDLINGAATEALAAVQYTAARIITDGNGHWYLV